RAPRSLRNRLQRGSARAGRPHRGRRTVRGENRQGPHREVRRALRAQEAPQGLQSRALHVRPRALAISTSRRAGCAFARDRVRRRGRGNRSTNAAIQERRSREVELMKDGKSRGEVAAEVGVSRMTLWRDLQALDAKFGAENSERIRELKGKVGEA